MKRRMLSLLMAAAVTVSSVAGTPMAVWGNEAAEDVSLTETEEVSLSDTADSAVDEADDEMDLAEEIPAEDLSADLSEEAGTIGEDVDFQEMFDVSEAVFAEGETEADTTVDDLAALIEDEPEVIDASLPDGVDTWEDPEEDTEAAPEDMPAFEDSADNDTAVPEDDFEFAEDDADEFFEEDAFFAEGAEEETFEEPAEEPQDIPAEEDPEKAPEIADEITPADGAAEEDAGLFGEEEEEAQEIDPAVFAAGMESAEELTVDTAVSFTLAPGEEKWFSFTASEKDCWDLTYKFDTYEGYNSVGWQVYNEYGNWINCTPIYPADKTEGHRFVTDAGQKIYAYICNYNDSEEVTGQVQIAKASFYAFVNGTSRVSTTISADYQAVKELSVDAYSSAGEETLTYSWSYRTNSMSDDLPLEGVTGNTITTNPLDENTTYYCYVSDGSESNNISFYLEVNNEFSVSADTRDYYLEQGETVELTPRVRGLDLDGLTYRWHAYSYDPENGGSTYLEIEEAGSTLTAEYAAAHMEYCCTVTDRFGNSASVYFDVYPQNHLTLYDAETGETYRTIYVSVGDTITLTAVAEADDTTQLTWSWSGADVHVNTLTLENIQSNGYYDCYVCDQYGNSRYVEYRIRINNHLQVTADKTDYTVQPGDSVTFNADITADNEEGISIKWYRYTIDDNGYTNWLLLPEEHGLQLQVNDIQSSTQYQLQVQDAYGNEGYCYYHITVDNGFHAYAMDTEYESKTLLVPYGETAALYVTTQAVDTEDMSFQWYSNNNNTLRIDDANTPEFITPAVTQARTYFCDVKDRYGTSARIWFYVNVDNQFSAYTIDAENDNEETRGLNLYVTPGQTTQLTVYTRGNDLEDLTYRWTYSKRLENGNWENGNLNGVTGDTYTTEPITARTDYTCYVEDKYGNQFSINFYLHPENHFRTYALQNEGEDGECETTNPDVYVTPGQTATLKVYVEADNMDGIVYRWVKQDPVTYNDVILTGETGDVLETEEITAYEYYYCEVRDQYGNSGTVSFNVRPENHLRVYALQNEGEDGENETTSMSVNVTPGQTAALKVYVEADNMDGIVYRWVKRDPVTYNDSILTGETGDVLETEEITAYVQYYCEVRDQYGNSGNVWFHVHPENHFRVYALQNEGEDGEYETDNPNLYVTPGQTAALKVYVEADNMDGIVYRWVKRDPVTYDDSILTGETGNVLETEEITAYVQYYCEVSDQFGGAYTIWFHVRPENHFRVYALQNEGEDGEYETGSKDVYVTPGQTAALKVYVEADNMDGIVYRWVKRDPATYNDSILTGETGNVLETEEITAYVQYYCEVSDQFGGSYTIWFHVRPENHFSAYTLWDDGVRRTNRLNVYATPGQSARLQVYVEADITDGIVYRWTKVDPDTGDSVILEEETGDVLETEAITAYSQYNCLVSDQFGNSGRILFFITPDNHFRAYTYEQSEEGNPDCETSDATYYINPGESATLKVYTEADDPEGISYTWYCDNEIISGAAGDEYVIDSVLKREEYECSVEDKYGNSYSVWFYVRPANNFRAQAKDSETVVTAAYGEQAALTVVCTGNNLEGVTYRWYDEYEEDWIEGETTDTYTPVVTCERDYSCYAVDAYGTSVWVGFTVRVENHLSVQVDMENAEYEDDDYYVTAEPGEDIVLKVAVSADDTSELEYEWYQRYWDDDDNYVRQTLATSGDSCKVEDLSKSKRVYFYVSDQYGNSETINFYISIDNEFNAYPDINTPDAFGHASHDGRYSYKPGDKDITLGVIAEGKDLNGLTYNWCRERIGDEYSYEKLEAETGSEITVPAEKSEYSCRVYDAYGDSCYLYFYVSTNNLTVDYDMTEGSMFNAEGWVLWTVQVKPNSPATLKVKVTADDMSGVTYEWYYYKYNETTYEDEKVVLPSQGTGCTYDASEPRYIYVKVSDSYGNSVTKNFNIRIDNGFSAYPEGAQRNEDGSYSTSITIPFSKDQDTITLKAIATADDMSGIQYNWDDDGEDLILNKTENTATVKAEEGSICCNVYDGYGNQSYLWFNLTKKIETDSALLLEEGIEQAVSASESKEPRLYRFVPKEDGPYVIYSKGSADTYGYLLDANGVEILRNDEDGEESNFRLKCSLTKGVTYYVKTRLYDSDDEDPYTVIAEKQFDNKLMTYPEGAVSDSSGNYPNSITLSFVAGDPDLTLHVITEAEDMAGISYQWRRTANGFYDDLDDKGDTLTVPAIAARYTCRVSDNYDNEVEVVFDVVETACIHEYDEGVVIREANCGQTGQIRYTCTKCGATRITETPTVGTHDWDEGVVTTPATCKDEGVLTHTCKVCHQTQTETIDKTTEHTWDEGVVTTTATCRDEGVRTFTCSVCGKTRTSVIPKTEDHVWDEGVVTTPATEDETGIRTYTCGICGNTRTEVIPMINHNWDEGEVTTPATCGEDGVKTYHCTDDGCDKTYTEVIPKTGNHSWDAGRVTTPATCKDDGVMTFTCRVCGAPYTLKIDKTEEHTWEDVPAAEDTEYAAPTCLVDGKKTQKCSVCGETRIVAIKAAGAHDWDTENAVTVAATCGKDGSVTTKCKNCDATHTEVIPNTGKHDWDEGTITRAATCTQEGLMHYTCKVCDTGKDEPIEKDPNAHSFDAWTVTTAATCTAAGTQKRTCSRCNHAETQSIPAEGHKLVKTAAKAATTAAAGNKEYYTCSVCGRVFSDSLGRTEITKASTVIAKLPAPAPANPTQTPAAPGAKPAASTTPAASTKPAASTTPAATKPAAATPVNPEGDPKDVTSVAGTEAAITAIKNDGDLAGSSFAMIQLRSPSQKKDSIKLSWNSVPGATGYIIYGNACGRANKFVRITEVTGTSYTHTGLKKGTYYKFNAVAYKMENGRKKVLATSKTIHVATAKGKVTNYKKVKVNKKKVTLKVKGKFKIKATQVIANKKLKAKKHRKVAFESSDPTVVTVSGKGKLKALKKGTAIIYVYSQSGTFAKVKVTVK